MLLAFGLPKPCILSASLMFVRVWPIAVIGSRADFHSESKLSLFSSKQENI